MINRKDILEDLMQSFHAMRVQMMLRRAGARVHAGLTPPQWIALSIIRRTDKCTVKDIAEKMDMTSSAATQVVEKLVQGGFVVRTESAEDRRAVVLMPSKKSIAEMARMKTEMVKKMSKAFEALNDRELQEFARLHKKIVAHISLNKEKRKKRGANPHRG